MAAFVSPPRTVKEYYEDTYRFQSSATVLHVEREREKEEGGGEGGAEGWTVVLDKTIFHPQGGGQPSDSGKMKLDNRLFVVEAVQSDRKSGIVKHSGRFSFEEEAETEAGAEFAVGETVQLFVDEARRRTNARLHSAGHLLDCAMAIVKPSLKASKGYHYADGAYVEYQDSTGSSLGTGKGGVFTPEDKADLCSMLQTHMDRLVEEAIPVLVTYRDESGRHVSIGEQDEGCGCGGTHVKNSSELGKVVLGKMQKKKK